jgi:hypothetical protein
LLFSQVRYLSTDRAVFAEPLQLISLSLFPVTPTLEHRASVKRFVSLQFLNLKTVGKTPSQGRYLHRTIQTLNKRTQISMRRVGFEPTIPVFERAKTVHALDRAAAVFGLQIS